MVVYAIKLKNYKKDSNGLPVYIWASKGQYNIITSMRNDVERRRNFIKIHGVTFSPDDIAYIEDIEVEKSGIPIPKYVLERAEQEHNGVVRL